MPSFSKMESVPMNQHNLLYKIVATVGSALVGAICGALVATFGQTISSSTGGIVMTVLLGCILGSWTGRLTGAFVGAICGVLLVAFGSVIGGSAVGVVLTIFGCALLGGWVRWVHQAKEEGRTSLEKGFCLSSGKVTTRTFEDHYATEVVLWN
jgi:hypothetical protein